MRAHWPDELLRVETLLIVGHVHLRPVKLHRWIYKLLLLGKTVHIMLHLLLLEHLLWVVVGGKGGLLLIKLDIQVDCEVV
jgi:hypothetical protein